MKTIRIPLSEEEYQKIISLKGKKSWRDFLFDLIEFKRKMEEESESLSKSSLKEPYVLQAEALRKLGSLMKVIREGKNYEEDWEFEAAALLPLYISNVSLTSEEKRQLLLLIANTIEHIIEDLYPEKSEEISWISQALRMLAKEKERIYDSSIDYLCIELRSRRKETPSH